MTVSVSLTALSPPPAPKAPALREAAAALEALFLAEMLESAGFGEARDALGGGAGEEQFRSVLVRAQAEHIAQNGGIGLAESIFQQMMGRNHDENWT
ncbi:Rod binding protein [Pontibaca methylaminivorans]|uniref:Rod binding protein n=2 Tax=Pontibaca methylaminivorans TaxID=515897 RepID=A0A1R3WR99_9RHOB|nr:rod-binding protein [Pontibaca methylaminivorans]SIT80461.1 Rod binding protein [Pontibaca methylaminivorans]